MLLFRGKKKSNTFRLYQSFVKLYPLEVSIENEKEYTAQEIIQHLKNISGDNINLKNFSLDSLFTYYQVPLEPAKKEFLHQQFSQTIYFNFLKNPFKIKRKSPLNYEDMNKEALIIEEIFYL